VIYVLDTNALSALMKGSAAVVERLAASAPADIAIPQPVLAEIAFGIERKPPVQRVALRLCATWSSRLVEYIQAALAEMRARHSPRPRRVQ
jgi:predicted nucleic acid-binding protein